jgi:hypothetical protein
MPSRYHPIEDGLWDDPKFDAIGELPEASGDERGYYAYLCSNTRQRPSGIYRATDGQLAAGYRWPVERVIETNAILVARDLIVRDGSWIFLPGYLKRQKQTDWLLKGVEHDTAACSSHIILQSFLEHYPLLRFSKDVESKLKALSASLSCTEVGTQIRAEQIRVESTKSATLSDNPDGAVADNTERCSPDSGNGKGNGKDPEAPAGQPVQPAQSGPTTGGSGKRQEVRPKALKLVMTHQQAVRAKSLCGSIESLLPKVRPFQPWVFLQRSVNQGLPVDDALQILVGIKGRWDSIEDPWAYAADVLRKEYQQYRIDLELREHEQRKREPARIGEILAQAQRRSEEKPW